MNIGDRRSARIDVENVGNGVSRVRVTVNDAGMPFVEILAERLLLAELWSTIDTKMRARLGLLLSSDGREER